MCQYKYESGFPIKIKFVCDEPSIPNSVFCIFHDKDHYTEHEQEAARRFEEKVSESISENKPLECFGYYLPEINFAELLMGRIFGQPVYFNETRFYRSADFSSTTFSGEAALFGNALFSKDTNFQDATFSGRADFEGATFSEETSFLGATFSAVTDFGRATFSGGAIFAGATFSGGAVFFEGATFSEETSFLGATFSEGASFVRATFSAGGADFSNASFSGQALFGNASFSKDTNFQDATFSEGAFFEGATFSAGGADFYNATFSATVFFDGATFSGQVKFDGATFLGEAYFLGSQFGEETLFRYTLFEQPNKVTFDDSNLSKVSFADSDITRIRFGDKIRWGGKDEFTIIEEEWLKEKAKGIDIRANEYVPLAYNVSLELVLSVYRNLRENYEFRLRYDDAGKFFIKEMELKRKYRETESENGFEIKENGWFRRHFSLTGLYYHLSRYGESISRPAIVGAITVLLSTLFWVTQSNPTLEPHFDWAEAPTNSTFVGFREIGNSTQWLKGFERSLAGFLPFLSAGGETKVGIIDYIIKIFGGGLTFVLLAIALRRKFERKYTR
jgi:uncharacterized protein YjbI with pentapeptide repeats